MEYQLINLNDVMDDTGSIAMIINTFDIRNEKYIPKLRLKRRND